MRVVRQQQADYRLTTAEIFYHNTEDPETVHSMIWQDYDMAPEFPELRKFLTYWSRHLDSVLHSVNVAVEKRSLGGGLQNSAYSSALH